MSARSGRTVAVTGGAGFVGLNIVRHLVQDGHRVISLDHAPLDATAQGVAAELGDRAVFVRCDVRDDAVLTSALADHAAGDVIHAAAITSPQEHDGLAMLDVNLRAAQVLLELARVGKIDRLVVVSSAAVFRSAETEAPLSEDHPVALDGPYAILKFAMERLVAYSRQADGVDATAVRLGSVYGPYERPTASRQAMSSIHRAIQLARRGEPILATAPEVGRDWTHAADVALGLSLLVRHDSPPAPLYHLGIGRNYTTRETLSVVAEAIPGTTVRWVEDPASANVPVAVTNRRAPLGIERARADLGFAPRYPLRLGVIDYLAHLDAHPAEMA
jgi:UDP-glucose 4-epimerase